MQSAVNNIGSFIDARGRLGERDGVDDGGGGILLWQRLIWVDLHVYTSRCRGPQGLRVPLCSLFNRVNSTTHTALPTPSYPRRSSALPAGPRLISAVPRRYRRVEQNANDHAWSPSALSIVKKIKTEKKGR